jgi:hypothetical protein
MKTNKLNEAQEHLNLANQILKEEYGLGYEEVPQEYPQEEAEMPQDENIARGDERISRIREVALEGLQDYAHDVDSEQYQFYKKIWLMCDKAVSEKDSVGEGNS